MMFLWIILVLLFLWAVSQPWVPNTFVSILMLFAIWTAGTLYYDVVIGLRILDHLSTNSYTEVPAQVIFSTDGYQQMGKAHTFDPIVTYAYNVGTDRYTNGVIRHGGFGSVEGSSEIQQFIHARPAGATIPAYISPSQPKDSVLIQGVPGIEYFLLLCLLPFNMFSLVSCTYLVHSWQMARTKSPTAGFRLKETPTGFCIELPPRNALWYDFCCYIGGMSTAGIAAVGVYMLFKPVFAGLALGTVAAVIVVSAGLTMYRAWLYSKGRFDLEADTVKGTLALPSLRGRRERHVLALSECDAIKVLEVDRDPDGDSRPRRSSSTSSGSVGTGKKGKGKGKSKSAGKSASSGPEPEMNYRLEILMNGAPDAKEDEKNRYFIVELEDEEPALRFADWLAGRLKLRRV